MDRPDLQTLRKVLPAGTNAYLYRVKHKDEPDPTFFFPDIPRALIWALLTHPRATPILNRDLSIEAFQKTFVGQNTPGFRFPNLGELVVAEYSIAKPIPYLEALNLTDSMFDQLAAMDETGAMHYVTSSQSVFKGRQFEAFAAEHVMTIENPVDLNVYLAEAVRLKTLEKQLAEAVVDPHLREMVSAASAFGQDDSLLGHIEGRVFRVVRYDDRFKHNFNHNVNWEKAWSIFFNAIAVKGQADVKHILDTFFFIWTTPEVNVLFNGGNTPGYTDCLESIYGFKNLAGSCFMDSTLMAMFAFKNSPFMQNMLMRPIPPHPPGVLRPCAQDPQEDMRMREEIKQLLAADIDQIMQGQRVFCTRLRQVLGSQCINAGQGTNLAFGIHDPSELYDRLVSALGYKPMELVEVSYRARDRNGTGESVRDPVPMTSAILPPLRADSKGPVAVSWPWSWISDYENVDSGDALTWRKTKVEIVRADCVVVHVDRRLGGFLQQGPRPPPTPVVASPSTAIPVVTSPAQAQPVSLPAFPSQAFTQTSAIPSVSNPQALMPTVGLIPGANTAMFLPAAVPQTVQTPNVQPIQSQLPATGGVTPTLFMGSGGVGSLVLPVGQPQSTTYRVQRYDETAVNYREIPVEQQFNINDRPYTLRAVVYPPAPGHYACILKCGTKWFNYDDTQLETVIARKPLPDDVAHRIIQTAGVLLFYYPPFPELSQRDQEQINALVAQMAGLRPQ